MDDPMCQQPADAAAGEDADRVEAGSDEIVLEFGRLADDRAQVGRKAFRAAEEFLDPDLERDRDAAHRLLEIGRHALPVRRNLAE
jgi:hypothetical protein